MLRYLAKPHMQEDPYLGTFRTNSIRAMDAERILGEVTDVTTDFARAEAFAAELTRMEVSILHFREVVEDFVAQQ